jgi:hypothetical protein
VHIGAAYVGERAAFPLPYDFLFQDALGFARRLLARVSFGVTLDESADDVLDKLAFSRQARGRFRLLLEKRRIDVARDLGEGCACRFTCGSQIKIRVRSERQLAADPVEPLAQRPRRLAARLQNEKQAALLAVGNFATR